MKKKKNTKKHKRGRCFLSLYFFLFPQVPHPILKPFLGFLRGPGKDSVLPGKRGLDGVFVEQREGVPGATPLGNGLEDNSCGRACASVTGRAALL